MIDGEVRSHQEQPCASSPAVLIPDRRFSTVLHQPWAGSFVFFPPHQQCAGTQAMRIQLLLETQLYFKMFSLLTHSFNFQLLIKDVILVSELIKLVLHIPFHVEARAKKHSCCRTLSTLLMINTFFCISTAKLCQNSIHQHCAGTSQLVTPPI